MQNVIIFFNGANLTPKQIDRAAIEFFKRYKDCIPFELGMQMDYTKQTVKAVFCDRIFADTKKIRVTNTHDKVYFYIEA